jgi:membrane protease YdiL (CAAX protease family)
MHHPITTRQPGGKHSAGSLPGFFALTFLATWTCYIAAVAWSGGHPPGAPLGPGVRALVLLGTFAPSLVALGLTARAQGGSGVRALLGRLFEWQVGARWYVFAVSYMALIRLTAAVMHRLVTGAWPPFSHEAWYVMVAATFFSTVIGGQAGEEIGWRGYALPRLAGRLGLGPASIVLGVIWALWHLPLFYLPGANTYGQSFPTYMLGVIGVSVAIAWLYWRTRGSLLLTMLMHSAINNTNFVPLVVPNATNPFALSPSLVAWLTTGLLWMCAAFFLVRMRRAELTGARGNSEPAAAAGLASGSEAVFMQKK